MYDSLKSSAHYYTSRHLNTLLFKTREKKSLHSTSLLENTEEDENLK